VMEHLSRCGDCREVVALALPATDSVDLPASSSAVRGAWLNPAWLSWPALRWGVVAAGIILVTSVGLLQYKQRAQQQQSVAVVAMPARQYEKIDTALQNAPSNVPSHDQAPAAQVIGRQDQGMAKVPAGAPQSTSGPKSAAGIGAASGIGFGSGSSKASPASPQNPNAQLPGAPAGQVSVSGASPAGEVQAESAPTAAQDPVHEQLAQNQSDLPSQEQRLNNLDVVKAKESVAPPAQSSVALARRVPSPNISLVKGAGSSPRWTISSSGVLQRSFDAGTTWEDVNVSQSSPANGARMQSAAELKNQDRNKKVRTKEANPVVVFRAVAALGPEVWAGGTSAMLYHSLDAGSYWTRVVPAEANASLVGDVISVEFSDTQHGKITTSLGELWMTSDDGQTWHKQQ
jgi:hypothetical protein